ncbi:hypothetical protein LY76DRAFT_588211 [Colletotrichum caudatum]|nr:hypothetical protein LY76DRAFT_588211 [Colletotrichum caudatum]
MPPLPHPRPRRAPPVRAYGPPARRVGAPVVPGSPGRRDSDGWRGWAGAASLEMTSHKEQKQKEDTRSCCAMSRGEPSRAKLESRLRLGPGEAWPAGGVRNRIERHTPDQA